MFIPPITEKNAFLLQFSEKSLKIFKKVSGQKKSPLAGTSIIFKYDQPSTIASAGHASLQQPQETHLSAAITLFPSFSLIASFGHSPSQAPQFRHSSALIEYAMSYLL